MAASSMPNLYVPEATPVTKTTSDSWTTPGHGRSGVGEQLDVSALRERHEEATRLNQELQRKCWEQLGRSPPPIPAPLPSHVRRNDDAALADTAEGEGGGAAGRDEGEGEGSAGADQRD